MQVVALIGQNRMAAPRHSAFGAFRAAIEYVPRGVL